LQIRTAVIGVGHLGREHARIHRLLSSRGNLDFRFVCDMNESRAAEIGRKFETASICDWRGLVGQVDAVSLAVPTESHAEIACSLLEAGVHVLVEKPISRTLEEAEMMIEASRRGKAVLQVGHLERFNPALVSLKPHVRNPLYFEIHRVGQFTARSLDIDVVLDLMIHDLDIVQWLVGSETTLVDIRAVGIPVLTNRVDASNARLEFSSGAVANLTASRVGNEKIRKMRFFQPHEYIAVDYVQRRGSISSLGQGEEQGAWPLVNTTHLTTSDIEPLELEIESFIDACYGRKEVAVTGEEGKRALSHALRVMEQIRENARLRGITFPD
jgi:predicted dehydrogenase